MANMAGEIEVNINRNVETLLDFVGGKQRVTNKFSPSIYKVPSTLRDLNPNSFQPRVVSIGPLHRKDENLKPFEVRKAAFVHDLLCRRSDLSPTQTLKACVQKVATTISDIKGSYVDIKSSYEGDDNELTRMMVMDACFILEFIHVMPTDSNLRLQDQHIPYDLLLLENQIPFFVLKGIYECIFYNFEERLSFTTFIHPLVKYTNLFEGSIQVGGSRSYAHHDHILGYLYHCYRPKGDISSGFPRSRFHKAVELDQAGVNFKPNQDEEWPMAMKVKASWYSSSISWFPTKPTFTMPILRIDDFTELVLRNLIAYEQSHAISPYVTSYARAMGMLIDDHEDIAKLVASKVMVNHIGSNQEAAVIINNICKEVAPEHFYYTEEWEQLDIHFNKYWPRKIVKYTSIIALNAGFFIFVLTLIQTICAVKSF